MAARTALIGGEVVLKALAQGMPELVPACSGGDVCSMIGLGVNPATGQAWLEATNEAVGFGGHAGGDGADGIMHLSEPGCRNNPVEVLETKSPMFIESYGYRPNSGGPGRYRGGVGVGRVYRFTAPSTGICLVYKTKTRPWSIGGGFVSVGAARHDYGVVVDEVTFAVDAGATAACRSEASAEPTNPGAGASR